VLNKEIKIIIVHNQLGHLHTQITSELLSRVSTLTRDIDIEILSVCLSVRPSVRPLRSGIQMKAA